MKSGEGASGATVISCIKQQIHVTKHVAIEHLKEHIHPHNFYWVIIEGKQTPQYITKLGRAFEINDLDIEDINLGGQRPKLAHRQNYLFVILHTLLRKKALHGQQLSMVMGKNYVISFHENDEEIIQKAHARLVQAKEKTTDVLAYIIIDMITDQYFAELEHVGEKIERLETTVLKAEKASMVKEIYKVKRELVLLRQTMWPIREVVSSIMKIDNDILSPKTKALYRDAYNEAVQVIETTEIFREMTASLLETHLSVLSNRMNQTMKVLTVIATIFIPLTFITGIYGMNFVHMPELQWKGAYFVVLGFMAVIAAGMIWHFRKRKWM